MGFKQFHLNMTAKTTRGREDVDNDDNMSLHTTSSEESIDISALMFHTINNEEPLTTTYSVHDDDEMPAMENEVQQQVIHETTDSKQQEEENSEDGVLVQSTTTATPLLPTATVAPTGTMTPPSELSLRISQVDISKLDEETMKDSQ